MLFYLQFCFIKEKSFFFSFLYYLEFYFCGSLVIIISANTRNSNLQTNIKCHSNNYSQLYNYYIEFNWTANVKEKISNHTLSGKITEFKFVY